MIETNFLLKKVKKKIFNQKVMNFYKIRIFYDRNQFFTKKSKKKDFQSKINEFYKNIYFFKISRHKSVTSKKVSSFF